MPEAPPPAATTPGTLIAARDLSVRLGGRTVLSNIEMEVAPGEIVTLIGPNGAGKTTLVRALLGLVKPSAGRVEPRPGLTIGYLPQRLTVDPVMPLTVRRFLTLTRRSPEANLVRALEEVDCAVLIDRPMQALSGGQTQRVLLARALLREPDLLVLDEPVQGVDYAGQYELFDLISRLRHARGCGVLMVSHDLHLVMSATDRVLCINHHLCCSGAPETVREHPEYQAMFGRAGAAHLAVYTHDHDHRHDVTGKVMPMDARANRERRAP